MSIHPSIIRAFVPEVQEFQAAPLGSGLIHRTFLVESVKAPYVFQELNGHVFSDLPGVMANILRVQAALAEYPEPTLTFLPRVDGAGYLAPDGEPQRFWRCAHHFPNTVTYDVAPGPAHLTAAAQAFARFGQRLSSLDSSQFHPTIPRFHDTPHRYETFQRAWENAHESRRSQQEYRALVDLAGGFRDFGLSGLLAPNVPQGVAHNDTKLNNCLFYADRPEVVCVIDLDTVMAGSWLLDFGDLCRTSVCALPEDTCDVEQICIDEQRFAAVTGGYMEVLRDTINAVEKERLVYAAFLMTYELALRFFTDHLQNDVYFGAKKPDHNLIRTRSQIRLAQCFLEQRSGLEAVVKDAFGQRSHPVAAVTEPGPS